MLRFKTINGLISLLIILVLIVNYFISISIYYYLILIFIWLCFTILGSTQIQWNYHFRSLNSNLGIKENHVSITFDDSPNPEFTPQVLSLLKEYNAKATFFCIGKNAEKYPSLVLRIIDEGHTVGNHTYSHAANFDFYSTERVISELKETNRIFEEKTNLKLKLFRPAYGITNPNIKRALQKTGHLSIGWSKRSFDTTSLSENIILKRVTQNLVKGDVILLHDASEKTVKVLEQLLLFLNANDLQSVTVDQLFSIKPYA